MKMQKDFNISLVVDGKHFGDISFFTECALEPGYTSRHFCLLVDELLRFVPGLVKLEEHQLKDEFMVMTEDDRLAWNSDENGNAVKYAEANFLMNASIVPKKIQTDIDIAVAVCHSCMNRGARE